MLYGELKSEKIAQENEVARKIVKEINCFEINERQRWLIIHMLALEIENVEEMKELVSKIRHLAGDKISITKIFGIEEQTEEMEK